MVPQISDSSVLFGIAIVPRLFVLAFLVASSGVLAQAPALAIAAETTTVPAQAGYDVASIKLSKPPFNNDTIRTLPTTFLSIGSPLRELIAIAFGVKERYVLGLPAWALQAHYDLNAKIAGPAGPNSDFHPRLQQLLMDRFHLSTHPETQEFPVLKLVQAKKGPKFLCNRGDKPPAAEIAKLSVGQVSIDNGHFLARAISMTTLAESLGRSINSTIEDDTQIKGACDVVFEWAPTYGRALPEDDSGPTIYTALQDQLGLELKNGKGLERVLVVDSVEHPTED